jgi:4-hydroxy-tetrahydrodipicolinate synthase
MMNKNDVDWRGAMVALVTPFKADGTIDEAGFAENVELCLQDGVKGVVVAGCTGEFWAVTNEERARLFRLCAEVVAGRVPVIANVGTVTTPEAIALAQAAHAAGSDGIMVLTPYFVKLSPDDLVCHFTAVAASVPTPMMLYNIPSHTGNPLNPALVARLATLDTVVAIKESSMDFNNFYKTLTLVGEDLHVFCGPATLYGVPAMLLGAPGYIDTIPNHWGREAVELHDAAVAMDLPRAQALQAKALALRELVSGNGRNPYAGIKTAMNLRGRPGGYMRPPLRDLGESDRREIEEGLTALGVAYAQPASRAAE